MDVAGLAGQTVLITGGAGFVGGHIAERLAPVADVRVLDNLTTGERARVPSGATLIEGDIRDADTLCRATRNVDVVFHEAGMVSVPASVEQPRECHRTNGSATLSLLELARQADATVVFASSAAIYGQPTTVPVAESATKTPTSPYGIEKLAADHYVRLYAERYGLPTVALRYFNVYGPGQSANQYAGVISTFLEQARSGGPITVEGDGEQTRDFVHVDDVVRANVAAATSGEWGTAVNVGTGTSTSINELASAVTEVTDTSASVTHTSARPSGIRHSRADVQSLTDVLGVEPRVSLRDGLATLTE